MNIDQEFPEGISVRHKVNNKTGIVQKDFGGPAAGVYYDPWEVPVVWNGDPYVSGVDYENLIKV